MSAGAVADQPPWRRPVHVAGASALCRVGFGWRGLLARVVGSTLDRAPTTAPPGPGAAMATGGVVPAVPALGPAEEPCERRQRKLMSRAAYLGAAAVKAVLADVGWAAPGPGAALDIGLFMGVGASGGEMAELEAMLAASVDGSALDLGRFGTAGLGAANPLYAFQLMNNFTLCHGAILAGLEGPNAAFYSRGGGTVTALREAAFAVAESDTPRALAGGADSALHPVTLSELSRARWPARGLAPTEGAALVALTSAPATDGPCLSRAELWHPRAGEPLPALVARALEGIVFDAPTGLVLAGWGPPARAALEQGAAVLFARAALVIDPTAALGEALAATPALAWCVALDWLSTCPRGRIVVLSAGIDGALGLVEFTKALA